MISRHSRLCAIVRRRGRPSGKRCSPARSGPAAALKRCRGGQICAGVGRVRSGYGLGCRRLCRNVSTMAVTDRRIRTLTYPSAVLCRPNRAEITPVVIAGRLCPQWTRRRRRHFVEERCHVLGGGWGCAFRRRGCTRRRSLRAHGRGGERAQRVPQGRRVAGRAAGGPDEHRLGNELGVVDDVDEGLEQPAVRSPSRSRTRSQRVRAAAPACSRTGDVPWAHLQAPVPERRNQPRCRCRATCTVSRAWMSAARAASVSRSGSSTTKSWIVPWYRMETTATPAARSFAA
ncbi:hypothetical protein QFZ68_005863 [Streptomyces sp. V1I6]|nr:hypothetical protein [Streptomyces sp. V1I6]